MQNDCDGVAMMGTIHHELSYNESIHISTDYHRARNESERVCIGWTDRDIIDGETISLQIIWFDQKGCEILQACLNESELDLVIKGLLDAKKHMRKVIKKSKTCKQSA